MQISFYCNLWHGIENGVAKRGMLKYLFYSVNRTLLFLSYLEKTLRRAC